MDIVSKKSKDKVSFLPMTRYTTGHKKQVPNFS